jgi:hypothetical protein
MVTRISTIGIVNNNRVIINLRKDADIELSNFQNKRGQGFPRPRLLISFLSPDLDFLSYKDQSGDIQFENR